MLPGNGRAAQFVARHIDALGAVRAVQASSNP